MVLQTYKVLVPFPHEGQMIDSGTVALSAKAASHLVAGGKVTLSTPKATHKPKSKAQSKAKSNKGN